MNGDEFAREHPLISEGNTTTNSHNTKSKNHKQPKKNHLSTITFFYVSLLEYYIRRLC